MVGKDIIIHTGKGNGTLHLQPYFSILKGIVEPALKSNQFIF